MTQRHLDRLSALDASFLHQEDRSTHTHIGALAIFAGPPPRLDDVLAHIEARLHLAPRYRQRLAHTPLDRGRPVWIDDPGFRLDSHVRHVALPSPGARDQLLALVSRTFSTQLDRRRPLWELWFVEGLQEGGFALVFKTHHAVIDGVAGVDLASLFFDAAAPGNAPDERAAGAVDWAPAREPGLPARLALGAVRDAREQARLLAYALAAAAHPRQAARRLRAGVEGIGEVAWAALHPAPETPLNAPIGPHRRFATASGALADFRTVGSAFGGTVNDVVLAVVSGALRRFLQARGVRTEGLELRALVPVSLRGAGEHGAMGNRVTAIRATLPVGVADPLARLEAVRAGMDAAKESRQALGVQLLAGVQDFAPPAILARASRLAFSTRLVNLLVTNVPGPQAPLSMLGHAIAELYPIAFLPRDHALCVAITSYDGRVSFGLLADHAALPELDQVAAWIPEAIVELVERARTAAQVARAS